MKPKLTEPRIYHELRTIVERQGGKMWFERRGHPPGGAWIVELDGKQKPFKADGHEFLDLASLYVPRRDHPTEASHYTCELVEGGEAKWLSMIRG